jgi:hypothetical protein
VFHQLHVRAGQHDVVLVKPGYHNLSEKVFVQPGSTFHIKNTMTRLAAGEAPDPAPAAPAPPPPPTQSQEPVPPGAYPPPGAPLPPPGSYPSPPRRDPRTAAIGGSVGIRVQPPEADVLIDGQPWHVGGQPLVIGVTAGRHHLEVHAPGQQPYSTDVDVRPGEMTQVNVSLRPVN